MADNKPESVQRGASVREGEVQIILIYMQLTFLILFFITRSMADQHFQMKLDSIRAGATNPLAVKWSG